MSAPDADLNRHAIKLYQSGNFNEAEKLYRRLQSQDPKNWQYALLLGLCRHGLGDVDGAFEQVRRAVDLGDGQPATHYYYGRLLTDNMQPGLAREQFAQAVALDPNHVEARTAMGLVSLMTGDFKRATSELKTALRAGDSHVPALAALARALIEQDEIEAAYPHALKAVKLDPQSVVAQNSLARVFHLQGQLDFSLQCFDNALALKPDSGELNAGKAAVLVSAQRDREALDHYIKALDAGFGGAGVVIETSICLERLDDLPQAHKLLRQAARRWPQDPEILVRLSELRMFEGDLEGAGQALASLDPNHPQAALMKARIANAGGERNQALGILTPLVEADTPGRQREARLLLARMIAESDAAPNIRLERARETLRPLLERQPPIPDAVLVWSLVLEMAGEYQQSCQALEELLQRDGIGDLDQRTLRTRLANCYDLADEPAPAWANWQKGGWRPAPHLARLESQDDAGLLERWLEHDWSGAGSAFGVSVPDDGLPTPTIVAGWPGSGRELLLAALAAHPSISTLPAEGERRRMEALIQPATPELLDELDEGSLRIGRKRFMRGAPARSADTIMLEAGWWHATGIPALARFFPGTTVFWPEADPRDLALQWRVSGYRDIDTLIRRFEREQQLWQSMRRQLPLTIVPIARADLIENPERAFGSACAALAIEPLPAMFDAAAAIADAADEGRFVADGRWRRYHAGGPASATTSNGSDGPRQEPAND